eukprot:Nk52_evm7s598 gene=Nk52_evmTU7s598
MESKGIKKMKRAPPSDQSSYSRSYYEGGRGSSVDAEKENYDHKSHHGYYSYKHVADGRDSPYSFTNESQTGDYSRRTRNDEKTTNKFTHYVPHASRAHHSMYKDKVKSFNKEASADGYTYSAFSDQKPQVKEEREPYISHDGEPSSFHGSMASLNSSHYKNTDRDEGMASRDPLKSKENLRIEDERTRMAEADLLMMSRHVSESRLPQYPRQFANDSDLNNSFNSSSQQPRPCSLETQLSIVKKQNEKLLKRAQETDEIIWRQNALILKYRKKFIQLFESDTNLGKNQNRLFAGGDGEGQEDTSESEGEETGFSRNESLLSSYWGSVNDSPRESLSPSPMASAYGSSSNLRYHDVGSEMGSTSTLNGNGPHKRFKIVSENEKDGSYRKGKGVSLWTAKEDRIFEDAYKKYGKSWKAIHESLLRAGVVRKREQVQSHGQYLIKTGRIKD